MVMHSRTDDSGCVFWTRGNDPITRHVVEAERIICSVRCKSVNCCPEENVGNTVSLKFHANFSISWVLAGDTCNIQFVFW